MATRRVNAVPLSERDFRRLSRATTGGGFIPPPSASSRHTFFLLWLAGTCVPPLIGLLGLLLVPSAGAALLLLLGLAIGFTNLALARATDWYRDGDWSTVGRQFALATGWASVVLIGTILALAVLLIVALLIAIVAVLTEG